MKKILLFCLFSFALTVQAEIVKVDVNGMVCSMCIQGIKKKFSNVDHITNVDVDLDKKVVTLSTHGKNDVADDKIKNLITEAGYEVVNITRQ